MRNKVTCAERLREALAIKGFTQKELCDMTGITKSAMSQYCTGGLTPRQIKSQSMAIALDVSEAWLIGYDVPMERTTKMSQADSELGSMMNVLEEIGALNEDGSLSDHGREVVTNMLRNNADMLKKLIDDEN